MRTDNIFRHEGAFPTTTTNSGFKEEIRKHLAFNLAIRAELQCFVQTMKELMNEGVIFTLKQDGLLAQISI